MADKEETTDELNPPLGFGDSGRGPPKRKKRKIIEEQSPFESDSESEEDAGEDSGSDSASKMKKQKFEEEVNDKEPGDDEERDDDVDGSDDDDDEEEEDDKEEGDESEDEDSDDDEEEEDGEGDDENEEEDVEGEEGDGDSQEDSDDEEEDGDSDGEEDDDEDDEEKCDENTEYLSDSEAEKCPVCLNSFEEQDVGCPESCDHTFCLECILEWSKNVNTCPVDRQLYHSILVRNSYHGSVVRRIEVDDRNMEEGEEEVDDEATYCEVCGRCDREDRLLLCDGCDAGYHCECLDPPLSAIPVEEWFCPECAVENTTELGETISTDEDEVVHLIDDDTPDLSMPRFRQRPIRVIARTRVSERVRASVQRAREQARRVEELVTQAPSGRRRTSTNTESRSRSRSATTPAASAGTSTSTTTKRKPKTTRKTTRKRKTPTKKRRKTRKRKTTRKKKTTGTTTGTKGKTRKRRRKRKTRKGKSKTTKRRTSKVKAVNPTTVRGRIATRLGLVKPRTGSMVPDVRGHLARSLDYQRSEIGVASLSMMGENILGGDHVEPSTSAQHATVSAAARRHGKTLSKSALSSHRPVARPLARHKDDRATETTCISTPPVLDLLGSIMHGQTLLHMSSSNVTISRDGSLKANMPTESLKKPSARQSAGSENHEHPPDQSKDMQPTQITQDSVNTPEENGHEGNSRDGGSSSVQESKENRVPSNQETDIKISDGGAVETKDNDDDLQGSCEDGEKVDESDNDDEEGEKKDENEGESCDDDLEIGGASDGDENLLFKGFDVESVDLEIDEDRLSGQEEQGDAVGEENNDEDVGETVDGVQMEAGQDDSNGALSDAKDVEDDDGSEHNLNAAVEDGQGDSGEEDGDGERKQSGEGEPSDGEDGDEARKSLEAVTEDEDEEEGNLVDAAGEDGSDVQEEMTGVEPVEEEEEDEDGKERDEQEEEVEHEGEKESDDGEDGNCEGVASENESVGNGAGEGDEEAWSPQSRGEEGGEHEIIESEELVTVSDAGYSEQDENWDESVKDEQEEQDEEGGSGDENDAVTPGDEELEDSEGAVSKEEEEASEREERGDEDDLKEEGEMDEETEVKERSKKADVKDRKRKRHNEDWEAEEGEIVERRDERRSRNSKDKQRRNRSRVIKLNRDSGRKIAHESSYRRDSPNYQAWEASAPRVPISELPRIPKLKKGKGDERERGGSEKSKSSKKSKKESEKKEKRKEKPEKVKAEEKRGDTREVKERSRSRESSKRKKYPDAGKERLDKGPWRNEHGEDVYRKVERTERDILISVRNTDRRDKKDYDRRTHRDDVPERWRDDRRRSDSQSRDKLRDRDRDRASLSKLPSPNHRSPHRNVSLERHWREERRRPEEDKTVEGGRYWDSKYREREWDRYKVRQGDVWRTDRNVAWSEGRREIILPKESERLRFDSAPERFRRKESPVRTDTREVRHRQKENNARDKRETADVAKRKDSEKVKVPKEEVKHKESKKSSDVKRKVVEKEKEGSKVKPSAEVKEKKKVLVEVASESKVPKLSKDKKEGKRKKASSDTEKLKEESVEKTVVTDTNTPPTETKETEPKSEAELMASQGLKLKRSTSSGSTEKETKRRKTSSELDELDVVSEDRLSIVGEWLSNHVTPKEGAENNVSVDVTLPKAASSDDSGTVDQPSVVETSSSENPQTIPAKAKSVDVPTPEKKEYDPFEPTGSPVAPVVPESQTKTSFKVPDLPSKPPAPSVPPPPMAPPRAQPNFQHAGRQGAGLVPPPPQPPPQHMQGMRMNIVRPGMQQMLPNTSVPLNLQQLIRPQMPPQMGMGQQQRGMRPPLLNFPGNMSNPLMNQVRLLNLLPALAGQQGQFGNQFMQQQQQHQQQQQQQHQQHQQQQSGNRFRHPQQSTPNPPNMPGPPVNPNCYGSANKPQPLMGPGSQSVPAPPARNQATTGNSQPRKDKNNERTKNVKPATPPDVTTETIDMEIDMSPDSDGGKLEIMPAVEEDVESSAVELYNKGSRDRYLQKLQHQERVVEEVKLAIKPFYQKKLIDKDEYKDILRKAVNKICHSRSGVINPVKVKHLVEGYVKKYQGKRKTDVKPKTDAKPKPSSNNSSSSNATRNSSNSHSTTQRSSRHR